MFEHFADQLIFLSIAAAIIGSLFLYVRHTIFIRPNRDHFKAKGFHLRLDNEARQIVIETDMSLAASRFAYGALKVTSEKESEEKMTEKYHAGSPATIYGTSSPGGGFTTMSGTPAREGWTQKIVQNVPTGLSRVEFEELQIPEHFQNIWSGRSWEKNSHLKVNMGQVFKLRNRDAKALQRWLRSHRKTVFPNEVLLKKKWNQDCQALLSRCQKQHKDDMRGAIESVRYFVGPRIRYLRITQAGKVWVAKDAEPELICVEPSSITVKNNSLVICMPNREMVEFGLGEKQVREFHKLQRSGTLVLA